MEARRGPIMGRIVWDTMINADARPEILDGTRDTGAEWGPQRVHLALGDYGARGPPKIDRADYVGADFKPL